MNAAELILVALVLPILAAVGIALAGKLPNLREGITLVTALVLFACVAQLLDPVLAGMRPEFVLLEPLPGLPIAFRVEPLGMLFALIASGLWIVNSVYSIGYMRGNKEKNQTRFYVCFALSIAAALAIAFAANLLTLFLFYEVLTLITYPLVTHAGTDKARRGGRTYLAILMGTSVLFLLPAVIYTWHVAGTTEFRPGGILPAGMETGTLMVLLALFMFGIGKAALMPFHRWLPAAMVAPTPVSALLHAVAVVKAGVFSVVKVIVYVFGLDQLAGATDWLIGIAGFSIVAASVVALNADNLKRRLAYSTVSQLSYVTLAAAILAPLSVAGAALHIAAHAFGKITLFFAAGAIYTAAHKTEVSQLDGIGRRMPWTMAAFGIGALSMIGLPPAAGFVSKWYIVSGAFAQAQWFALAVIFISTLLNAGYFLPILYRAFFRPLSAEAAAHPHGEAPLAIVIALTFTAAGTLALFFFPDVPLALAQQLVKSP
ncbi:MAG: monovalent cation/H+ antiporter subunit D family protein [Gammaproteobacteria bacterium]|nr:monovalent cation/H+ antiporter subunit D family protein [Rhodocyclaceae bacterium]MBU3909373.1 monovalent cation/H+ antiporter subunit D family protein [Gammaproteobacteria bacterium]MBU3990194.1 monovalent cation/H+ antiporter subunit D family protein [Gammaproteobacteria bacterium]MBU4005467.1 monovalent cation/H+ antiporter subunit D family protein [Gammaproteobacteria bacterium]MBU4020980.1 monovalent cation/H+ antiporter subunit D family protein [Gammaproteobacteria bacterium]